MRKSEEQNLKVIWEVNDEVLGKSETLTFNHSNHSLFRAKERKINNKNISIAIEYGTAFFKQGLIYYVLGENNLPEYIMPQDKWKYKNLIVIVAGDTNTILTCYKSKNPFKHIKKKRRNLCTHYSIAS